MFDNKLEMYISLIFSATDWTYGLAQIHHTALLHLCSKFDDRFTLAQKLFHPPKGHNVSEY